MAFHTPEGASYAAQINSDGTYNATDIPTGELVITVETESVKAEVGSAGGKDAGRRMGVAQQQPPAGVGGPAPEEQYIKIPSKYANPKTSPLTVTLSAGRKVHNIDLTD